MRNSPRQPSGILASVRNAPITAINNSLPRPDDAAPVRVPPLWRRGAGIAPGTWDYAHRDSIAAGYDQFVSQTPLCRLDESIIQAVLPDVCGDEDRWVADFGCGTGRTALPLRSRGYQVLGVDLSQSMLAQMRSKSIAIGENIYALRANLVTLDALADDCVDHAVCMFATLGMIRGREHRQAALAHFRRLVRPGGTLIVHVHHRWGALRERGGVKTLVRSALSRSNQLGDAVYAYRGVGEMFMHRYGRIELGRDLSAAGWKNQRLHRISREGDRIARRCEIAGGFIVVSDRK